MLVIGANDVTNPAAQPCLEPIYGMPILDVDKARTVMVIKDRGMSWDLQVSTIRFTISTGP